MNECMMIEIRVGIRSSSSASGLVALCSSLSSLPPGGVEINACAPHPSGLLRASEEFMDSRAFSEAQNTLQVQGLLLFFLQTPMTICSSSCRKIESFLINQPVYCRLVVA